MRTNRVRITPTLAVLAALAGPTGLFAGDHHREHPMPHIDWGVKVSLRPGEAVKVATSFDASNENCVQVYDQSNGRLLQVWNNYDGGAGEWYSTRNSTTDTIVLLIVSRHKDTGPDGGQPWNLSRHRALDGGQESGTMKFGFEDGADGDYNDALATITWIR